MAKAIGIKWDDQPLGEMSDRALAEKLGCSDMAVSRQRRKRGIKPHLFRYGRYNIDWDAQPLGKVGDHKLARKLGVNYKVVLYQRQKRGIAPKFLWHAKQLNLSVKEMRWLNELLTALLRGADVSVLIRRKEFGAVYGGVVEAWDQMKEAQPEPVKYQ